VRHFLLVYDRLRGELLEEREFSDRSEALKARFAAERAGRPDHIEIVVLHADSPETIRRTHARYFQSFGEIVRGSSMVWERALRRADGGDAAPSAGVA
jgi:hypothetical protein